MRFRTSPRTSELGNVGLSAIASSAEGTRKSVSPSPHLRSPAEREKQTDIDSVYVNGGNSCGIGCRIFEKVSIRERLNCHSRDTMRASREPQPPPAQSQYCPKQLTRVSLRRYIRFAFSIFRNHLSFFLLRNEKRSKAKACIKIHYVLRRYFSNKPESLIRTLHIKTLIK